jgi:hypothetical protein
MENQFIYIVEIYNAKTEKGISADETVTFSRVNPLEARAEAISHAYGSLQELEAADENEDFIVEVFFVHKEKHHRIFGDDDKLLDGLLAEAKSYLENEVIDSNSLAPIFRNISSIGEDPGTPRLITSKEDLIFWPNMKYEEVFVLSQDLNLIFE